ncbi:hypothetical protein DL767_002985 [Monosporascus sp. MG133]|nr:hypothetical protein DL767_002985 [Monosporascus sp. MG133]
MTRLRSLIAFAYLGTSIAAAQEVVYVTDLSIFTVLYQTYDSCPEAVEELQACVCTKNNNFESVSSEISSSVSYSCGGTATDDQASAASVLSAYCNQADITPFPEPAQPVSEYIVDLPAFQELAPCAMSGVSRALDTMASGPPGDMTYYITALSEYSALAPCAQSAVSYGVEHQTDDYCPGDPQALASCVCLKEGISRIASSVITSNVQYWCASTATDDISSAIAVFDYYCSAAKAEVTPDGVTESVSPTAETGNTVYSGPTQTSESTPGFDDTDIGGSGSGDSGFDGSSFDNLGFEDPGGELSSGSPNGRPAPPNTGAIVGAVVGVVVGLALIGAAAFFLWRRSRKAKSAVAANGDLHIGTGKSELDGTVVATAPVSPPNSSPSPSGSNAQHPSRTDNISPVSTTQKASERHARSPATQASELHVQSPGPQMSELHGQNTLPPQTVNAYFHASGPQDAFCQPVHEAPVQHPTQVHEMHAQPETRWQSGPIMQYHEMDGAPHQWRAQR